MRVTKVMIAIGLLGVATSASALEIQYVFDATVSATGQSSFRAAAKMWENILVDQITVRIFAKQGYAKGYEAGTNARRVTFEYVKVRNALVSKAGYYYSWAEQEATAMKALPTGTVPVKVQTFSGVKIKKAPKVTMTTANAKALGLIGPHQKNLPADPRFKQPGASQADAMITISSSSVSVSTIAHEIGHVLGFLSNVDTGGYFEMGLYPMTLDLFRFYETKQAHNLTSENRTLEQEAAEYYDSVQNNVSLSRGMTVKDPWHCTTMTNKCQASHWRDNLPYLMTPTTGSKKITDADRHAVDYIGYNTHLAIHPSLVIQFGIVHLFPHLTGDLFTKLKATGHPTSLSVDVESPFEATSAAVIGLNVDVPGLERRSGAGFARWAHSEPNPYEPFDSEGELEGERIEHLPTRLLDLYFESDRDGPRFVARALMPESGSPFDPTLGSRGGYVVPLGIDFIDNDEAGDIDAIVTLTLLTAGRELPEPEASLSVDTRDQNTGAVLFDPRIFEL